MEMKWISVKETSNGHVAINRCDGHWGSLLWIFEFSSVVKWIAWAADPYETASIWKDGLNNINGEFPDKEYIIAWIYCSHTVAWSFDMQHKVRKIMDALRTENTSALCNFPV
jgi:hypothetical protein